MIRVVRTPAEPPELASVRQEQLQKLRSLKRPPEKDEIAGYRVVAPHLWRMQDYKCCYCEQKLTLSFQDVEHFRPKTRADRAPGCPETHGYWWLAFTWQNLLFACALCNRTHKRDRFPLKIGSTALCAEEDAPGQEARWLLDPAEDNGVEHIVFLPWSQRVPLPKDAGPRISPDQIDGWRALARNGSQEGDWSILVYGLNDPQHQELYLDHVRDQVLPYVKQMRDAIAKSDRKRVKECFQEAGKRLLTRSVPYVGLSYDALRYFVPDREIARFRVRWPPPSEVGQPPRATAGAAPPAGAAR